MIEFRCVHCSELLQAPPNLAGERMECPHCGNLSPVPARAGGSGGAGPAPACSRVMYVVLGIFLGALGVHNFVAGRTGPGIAQLLITLLLGWLFLPLIAVWIWVIVELCTVKHDARGILMS